MITFSENKEIFGNEIIIQAFCPFLKDSFKMPFRGTAFEVEKWKQTIEKQALFMLADQMLAQRLQNYNFGEPSGQKLEILSKAREKLHYFQNTGLSQFIIMYKQVIIPAFHQLMPPFDSKYHDAYNNKVIAIEKYLKSKQHE